MLKNKVNSIGIIIDGNRRWAVKNGMNKLEGHKYGLENLIKTISWAEELGISQITFYILSTENWKRSKLEISALMKLFEKSFKNDFKKISNSGAKIKFIGDLSMFPKKILKLIKKTESENLDKNKIEVFLAASYGGKNEIINGVKKMSQELTKREIEEITEKKFERFLSTNVISDPEIIIRTGGDKRLSNFLLWKSAYSELFFLEKTWPDFRKKDLEKVLDDYQSTRINKGK